MEMMFVGGLVFDGKNEAAPGLGVLVKNGRVSHVAGAEKFDGFQGPREDTTGGIRSLRPVTAPAPLRPWKESATSICCSPTSYCPAA